ncbi:hypothetical protein [Phyllobacterium myrsinacearum]|uniref:Peptidase C39-like domain-containing protein n=1 Tax=Phyllobacterium myrsinacearum TaxID=28101 RepID=A0A839ESS3_9HYPH|nr:hypothetical protein [Phyllobacterium myrsinacearum]MBA8881842.1 hypothetical protein [Phyllobacterium myrsinacearum]
MVGISEEMPVDQVRKYCCGTVGKLISSNMKAALLSLCLSALSLGYLGPALAENAPDNSDSAGEDAKHTKRNDIPPRLQWEANYGYCGEVALISAGLYYGQYVSQYDARAIASKNADQTTEKSQLLLGVNDSFAAKQMHLNAVEWNTDAKSNADDFLVWVRKNAASSYPVIIGVYMNHSRFQESGAEQDAGHEEYDHIVPVMAISSVRPFAESSRYDGNDVITFSDNGLYTGSDRSADKLYRSSFEAFQADRRQANSKSRPLYSLRRSGGNYGLAVKGVMDRDGQTLPVRVSTNRNYEKPSMNEGSNARPAPMKLTLTVKVSGLKPGVSYTLYRYDNFKSVPDASFNTHAANASKNWPIKIQSGSSFTVKEEISSDQSAIFRAVPSTAP